VSREVLASNRGYAVGGFYVALIAHIATLGMLIWGLSDSLGHAKPETPGSVWYWIVALALLPIPLVLLLRSPYTIILRLDIEAVEFRGPLRKRVVPLSTIRAVKYPRYLNLLVFEMIRGGYLLTLPLYSSGGEFARALSRANPNIDTTSLSS
jgi:MFS family permease